MTYINLLTFYNIILKMSLSLINIIINVTTFLCFMFYVNNLKKNPNLNKCFIKPKYGELAW